MPFALDPDAEIRDHVVQLYEHDADLVAGAGAYLIDAARAGAVTVVIATAAHREAFVAHLATHDVDPPLVLLDAQDTLARLMGPDGVDRDAFFAVVGGLMRKVVGTGRPVRAYGEMVALLWDAGEVAAAIELERLWNELAGELPFSLYCSYQCDAHADAEALHGICALHSAVVPGPGDVAADFPVERASATAARRLVADAVEAWGHDEELVADAELVVSELATNAIVHTGTPFRVSVRRHGALVHIAVQDGAAELPAVLAPDRNRPSGRGMHLVSVIARRWGVERTPGGKTVWAELGG